MLELVRMDEDELFKADPYYSHTFTLTFQDKKLPEEYWSLLGNELTNFKGYLNHFHYSCQPLYLDNSYYINLFVSLEYEKFPNNHVDQFLENLNIHFRSYYTDILETIQLKPEFTQLNSKSAMVYLNK